MNLDTSKRSQATEYMDDFNLEGPELKEALDKIASINRLLGGNKVTISGIKKILKTHKNNSQNLRIVDIGCGNGDMLRALATFGKNNNLNLDLVGIDANEYTIKHAEKLSENYTCISYECLDVFTTDFSRIKSDITLLTLTLHHFSEIQILQLLKQCYHNCNYGIVINDLQRSKLAYRLFQAVCAIFNLNKLSREDGLISILRGFKKDELIEFSKKLHFKCFAIKWKWAFRYQWIIFKV